MTSGPPAVAPPAVDAAAAELPMLLNRSVEAMQEHRSDLLAICTRHAERVGLVRSRYKAQRNRVYDAHDRRAHGSRVNARHIKWLMESAQDVIKCVDEMVNLMQEQRQSALTHKCTLTDEDLKRAHNLKFFTNRAQTRIHDICKLAGLSRSDLVALETDMHRLNTDMQVMALAIGNAVAAFQ